ncbi:uncharacterized protein AMSG_11821 [Thecamonas trahens ATCC 50062]|uniref:Uncharacterized protein n=1 Tax=Thecamonas trahens ATCC 50062 TaxID=461836 RepID=A0A0L0D7I5_THETB|nr:hypothetical protein AMSG_11821 [Thecamonas trahens ATCC 50062]KNC48347.1 hypothetical protein AMSG_11821 [Thecamonas trahens ATCC 50062]|eukprot:XP_013758656.1 hypothetical protein AMSG_11821 [Thecamonas trahens ATCC 50062]
MSVSASVSASAFESRSALASWEPRSALLPRFTTWRSMMAFQFKTRTRTVAMTAETTARAMAAVDVRPESTAKMRMTMMPASAPGSGTMARQRSTAAQATATRPIAMTIDASMIWRLMLFLSLVAMAERTRTSANGMAPSGAREDRKPVNRKRMPASTRCMR